IDWLNQFTFQIEKFGNAEQLGCKNDIDFVDKFNKGEINHCLLKPSDKMLPDGLLLIRENSKCFAIVLSIKYSRNIKTKTFQQSLTSTDLEKVYCKVDGSKVIKGYAKVQKQFH